MSRKSLMSSVAGVALAAATFAAATPASAQVNLGGYAGPITVKFSDFESLYNPSTGAIATGLPAVGDEVFGIITVTSISSNTGSPVQLWHAGSPGDGYLIGVYVGPTLTSQTIVNSNNGHFLAGAFTSNAPSFFDIYASATQLNASQGTGGYGAAGCSLATLCYNGITNAGLTLELALSSVPGISSNNTTYTNGTYTGLTPLGGSDQEDLDVTSGAAKTQFHTLGVPTADALNPLADLYEKSSFCTNGVASCQAGIVVGNWQFLSQDPVNGNVIPEPTSVALFGTSLLALGFFGWRSRKRS